MGRGSDNLGKLYNESSTRIKVLALFNIIVIM